MTVGGKLTDHNEEQCLYSIVLRVVGNVSPLTKYLENLGEVAISFGLHLKKRNPIAPTPHRQRSPEIKSYMTLIVSV